MKLLLRSLVVLLIATFAWAQAADHVPLSRREVEDLLSGSVPQKRIAALITQYGIQFIPDANNIAALRDKGAQGDVIDACKKTSIDHSLKAAQDLVSKGLNDDAAVSLQNALAVDDSDPKIWTQLGDLQHQNRQFDQAAASYRRAHQLFPESAQISVKFADASVDAGDAATAIPLCREVARVTPEDSAAHLCLAKALSKQGDNDGAIREADKASLLGSRDPALYGITPNTVMAKFINAIGGIPMLRTIRSIHQVGTDQFNSAQGLVPYDSDDYIYYPDRFVHALKNNEKKVDQRAVYSPSASFLTNGKTSRDLNDAEKNSYVVSLSIGMLSVAMNYNQPGYTYKAAGTELIDGKVAAIVDITANGNQTRWYMDPDSGLVRRIVRNAGGHTRVTNITDWKTSEGITLPWHTVNSEDGKLLSNYELRSFELNPPDNPSLFTRPAAVANTTTTTPTPAPAQQRRILVVSHRTHAHERQSSPAIYNEIVGDLTTYLRLQHVALTADSAYTPVDFGKGYTLNAAVNTMPRSGASNLLVITVDRPFNAWVKITAQYYDATGIMAWEENADARGLIEMGPAGIKRAIGKLEGQLNGRIQQRALPLTDENYVAQPATPQQQKRSRVSK